MTDDHHCVVINVSGGRRVRLYIRDEKDSAIGNDIDFFKLSYETDCRKTITVSLVIRADFLGCPYPSKLKDFSLYYMFI